jgi:hypothetical protein
MRLLLRITLACFAIVIIFCACVSQPVRSAEKKERQRRLVSCVSWQTSLERNSLDLRVLFSTFRFLRKYSPAKSRCDGIVHLHQRPWRERGGRTPAASSHGENSVAQRGQPLYALTGDAIVEGRHRRESSGFCETQAKLIEEHWERGFEKCVPCGSVCVELLCIFPAC